MFAASTAWASPPNILLIVAEDMSPRVGAYGDRVAQTPVLDQLAREGVRFSDVYSVAGVCAPNRSALITGVYPQSMGTQHMRTSSRDYLAVPPPAVKAFPELLRRAGYATANASKTDYQFGEPSSIWDVNVGGFADPAELALWRQLPADRPFFAMINLTITHESQLATAETRGPGPYAGFIKQVVQARSQTVARVTDADSVVVPPYYPDVPAVRASIAQHYDNIHHMDGQVGQILRNLNVDGLSDRTIVIWTTDHGDGLPRAKRSVYDSGLLVPLIVRYPDGSGAATVDGRLISFVDLAPTILGLAGAPVPPFIQGRDILAAGTEPRDFVFAARDRMDNVPDRVRAARDQRFKYIRNYLADEPYFRPLTFRDMFPVMQTWWQGHADGSLNSVQAFYFQAPRPPEELYDTVADPYEVQNLAGDPAFAEPLRRLRGAMDEWLSRVGDLSSEPEDLLIERMWPGGAQPVTAPPAVRWRDGLVELGSPTPGASIEYRVVDAGAAGRWRLYTEPVAFIDASQLQARAVRYGYAASEVVTVQRSEPES